MTAASLVSQELESYGVGTFSAKEMAFNTPGLMHPLLFNITQVEPIWADLNGGMDRLPDLADITSRIQSEILKKSDSPMPLPGITLPISRLLMASNLNVSSRPSTSPPVVTSSSISQPCIPPNHCGTSPTSVVLLTWTR